MCDFKQVPWGSLIGAGWMTHYIGPIEMTLVFKITDCFYYAPKRHNTDI